MRGSCPGLSAHVHMRTGVNCCHSGCWLQLVRLNKSRTARIVVNTGLMLLHFFSVERMHGFLHMICGGQQLSPLQHV